MAFIFAHDDATPTLLTGSVTVTFQALEQYLPPITSAYPGVAVVLKEALAGRVVTVSPGSLEVVLGNTADAAGASAVSACAVGKLCSWMRHNEGGSEAVLNCFYAAAVATTDGDQQLPKPELVPRHWKLQCAEQSTEISHAACNGYFLFFQLHRVRGKSKEYRPVAAGVHRSLKRRQQLGHVVTARSFVLAVDQLLDFCTIFNNLSTDASFVLDDEGRQRVVDLFKDAGYTEDPGNPLHLYPPTGDMDIVVMSTSNAVTSAASAMTTHALKMHTPDRAVALSNLVPVAISSNAVALAVKEAFPLSVPSLARKRPSLRVTRPIPPWRSDLRRALSAARVSPISTPTTDAFIARIRGTCGRTRRKRCQEFFTRLAAPTGKLFGMPASYPMGIAEALAVWNRDADRATPIQVSKHDYSRALDAYESGNASHPLVLSERLPPVAEGATRLFHGCSERSAFSILQGIRIGPPRLSGDDFGPAFYLTPNWNYAVEYADHEDGPRAGQGAIVVFDVHDTFFENQRCLRIHPEDHALWQQVVHAGYHPTATPCLNELLRDFTVVQGPAASDPHPEARQFTMSTFEQVALRVPSDECTVTAQFRACSEARVVLLPFTPTPSGVSSPSTAADSEHDA